MGHIQFGWQDSEITRLVHTFRWQYLKVMSSDAWRTQRMLFTIYQWYRNSDLSDKIKRGFFQTVAVSILSYGCTSWSLTKRTKLKFRLELLKNAWWYLEEILFAALHLAAAVQPLIFYHTNLLSKTNKTCRAQLGK